MGWQSWQQARKVKIGDSIAKGIYLYLAECFNEQTAQCNPSQETIAEELEVSLPSVKRKLKYLTQIGLILPAKKTKNNRRTGTNYEIFYGITQNGFTENGISETPSMVSGSQSNGIPEIPKQELEQETEQEDNINSAGASELDFEIPNVEAQDDLSETIFWIQRQKGLKSRKNFPETEWEQVVIDVSAEGITGDGFKEFYIWVEGQSWVKTVSPNLLKSQVEAFINREQIAKKQAQNRGNQNGTTYQTSADRRNQNAIDRLALIEQCDNILDGTGIEI